MGAVKEFGRLIADACGAPAGSLTTYIEVPFKLGKQELRPDGLIRVARGNRSWTALVEVKTGKNHLTADQVDKYVDLALANGFDAVLTISNELPPVLGSHPVTIDKRKLRKVGLYHFSWVRIISSAVMQKEFRGVEDPDQAWILGELIRYLEHDKSGALNFDDMGSNWTAVRDDVRRGTLRKNDPGVTDVATTFDALIRYTCLHLGRRLGTEVTPKLSKRLRDNPQERTLDLVHELDSHGTFSAVIHVPGAAADLHVTCDLRTQQIRTSATVDASDHSRSKTRITWLTRQLKNAPPGTVVEAFFHRARTGVGSTLEAVREEPEVLVHDAKADLRKFQIALISPMGTNKLAGKNSFIDSVIGSVDVFYGSILQQIKPWRTPAPALRPDPPEQIPTKDKALSSTELSSQDGPETEETLDRSSDTEAAAPS